MMNLLVRVTLACGLLLLAHCTAKAQTQPPVCPPVDKPYLHVPMVEARTGCPLSAAIQITHTQTLVDGTHIQQSARELVYRDSLGRIRYESYARGDTVPRMVEIYDPVEGLAYTLFPQKDTVAYRHKLGQPAANAKVGTQVQHSLAPETKVASETLGPEQLEGVLATGTRITRTIPAGAEDNDRALTIVGESWRSSDIGVTLLEKTSDFQNGDSERRMTNLQQTEPDPTLFQVPADYTVQDQ